MEASTVRSDWLAARKQGLGGSDIAALFCPPSHRPRWLSSPLDVYCSKVIDDIEDTSNDVQVRGKFLERGVIAWYEHETESVVSTTAQGWSDREVVTMHPLMIRGAESWMLMSPDGGVLPTADDVARVERGIEAKTSRSMEGWGEPGTDHVPFEKLLQIHWYLAVSGLPVWDLPVYFPIADKFAIYTVHADKEIADSLLNRAAEWWQKHIVGRQVPEIRGSDSRGVLELFRRGGRGEVERASETEESICAALAVAKAAKEKAEAAAEALETQLKASIGERYGIEGDAGRAVWSPVTGSDSIDTAKIKKEDPALHASLLERFTKKRAPSRRLYFIPNDNHQQE